MYKDKDGIVEDSFQAFLVEGADFTKDEEYPIQKEWMVPQNPPVKVMPFFKAITYQGDLSEYYIYFYSPDGTELWCAYHCLLKSNPMRVDMDRHTCIQKIDFDKNDYPVMGAPVGINKRFKKTYIP